MYKMVVSDFDGTLIDEYEAISLSTMLEIDKVRKDKVVFVIATERCLSDILYYNRDFSFIDYIVACGGAIVYDVKRENVIFKKSISKSTITKVLKSVKNEIFGLRKDRKFILHDLEDIQDIYKLEVVCKNLEEAVSIKEKLLEIKNITCYVEITNDAFYVGVTSLDINKLSGVMKICTKKKINLEEVAAIGDGEGDIELLDKVGCSGSVSNAIDKVKRVSKIKVASNEDKGVEEFLKKIFE